ncbi:MAG TPA: hypothetical protein VH478_03490 [Trebonia sp.]|nr:hypothetical protein [Trebonia sp.]
MFALPRDLVRVSVLRSLYLSLRFGGRIIIVRGTRLRLERGARIEVPAGCRLLIGNSHVAGAPASLHMRRGARLAVRGQGRVTITRSARILIMDGALLEIGGETTIHYNATVTCLRHISMAPYCAISWNTNILDGNMHELVVDGVPARGSGRSSSAATRGSAAGRPCSARRSGPGPWPWSGRAAWSWPTCPTRSRWPATPPG